MIYDILFITLLSFGLLTTFTKEHYENIEKKVYILCCITLFLISACRYKTGYDWYTYEELYSQIKTNTDTLIGILKSVNVEPGYTIISFFSPTHRMVIIICACLGVLLKCAIFYNFRERFLLLFTYYCSIFVFYDMGVVRQGIAIGITFWGIQYIKERKKIKYFLTVCIACCFHITAIIAIPLYFLSNKQFSRKFYYLSLLAVATFFNKYFFYIVFFIIKKIGFSYITFRIEYYLLYTARNSELLSVGTMVKRSLFLILFIEYYKNIKSNKDIWIYLNGYYLAVILMFLLQMYPVMAGRGTATLYFLQIFIFADMIYKNRSLHGKLFFLIILLVLNLNTLNGVIYSDYGDYLPYQNYIRNQ